MRKYLTVAVLVIPVLMISGPAYAFTKATGTRIKSVGNAANSWLTVRSVTTSAGNNYSAKGSIAGVSGITAEIWDNSGCSGGNGHKNNVPAAAFSNSNGHWVMANQTGENTANNWLKLTAGALSVCYAMGDAPN